MHLYILIFSHMNNFLFGSFLLMKCDNVVNGVPTSDSGREDEMSS
jgi:hypothetical protein